ncbi:MAG: hypothetical protein ACLFTY_03810 [Candidatus Aenigmatarchaeota archaeon]
MLFEDYSQRVASYGFISGLVIGQLAGIMLSFITALNVTTGIINGAGAGIFIAMISAHFLITERFSKKRMIVPFSLGLGTVIGTLVGVSTAWSYEISYLSGFSYGSITGLVVGTVLGIILWKIPSDGEDEHIVEEVAVEEDEDEEDEDDYIEISE